MDIKMDIPAIERFLREDFPQADGMFEIVSVDESGVIMALNPRYEHLRPGGTISGPAMFALADVCAFFCVMSQLGPSALTVTTNCSLDFMRKPVPDQKLLCHMELLKLGRQLAVTEGRLYSDGAREKPVARASLTYSIPPR